MNKDMEKVTEAMEKGADKVINTFVDRVVDRVDQMEPTVEKEKKTLKKNGADYSRWNWNSN